MLCHSLLLFQSNIVIFGGHERNIYFVSLVLEFIHQCVFHFYSSIVAAQLDKSDVQICQLIESFLLSYAADTHFATQPLGIEYNIYIYVQLK